MYEALKKSEGVAFALWFIFGVVGGHRFYLKRPVSAIIILILTCTLYGLVVTLVWWVIDAFLIIGMTKEFNLGVIRKIEGAPEIDNDTPAQEVWADESAEPNKPNAMVTLVRSILFFAIVFLGTAWFLADDTDDFFGYVNFVTGVDFRTPLEVSRRYTVTASTLNQRNCASPGCDVVGKLSKGESVQAYEVKGRWIRVSASAALDDEKWVSGKYLKALPLPPAPSVAVATNRSTTPIQETNNTTSGTSTTSTMTAPLTYKRETQCLQEQAKLGASKSQGWFAYCHTTDNKLFAISMPTMYQLAFCKEDTQELAQAMKIRNQRNTDVRDCRNVSYFKPGDTVYGAVYRGGDGRVYNYVNKSRFSSNPSWNVYFDQVLVSRWDPNVDYDPPLVKQMLK